MKVTAKWWKDRFGSFFTSPVAGYYLTYETDGAVRVEDNEFTVLLLESPTVEQVENLLSLVTKRV